jgi:hypothetical protein
MAGLIQPGQVLKSPEAHYLYGLGDLVLRVMEVGTVRRLPDGDWLKLKGGHAGLERREDGRARSAGAAIRPQTPAGTVMATYLAAAALEQLDQAQAELDPHLVTGADWRCRRCGGCGEVPGANPVGGGVRAVRPAAEAPAGCDEGGSARDGARRQASMVREVRSPAGDAVDCAIVPLAPRCLRLGKQACRVPLPAPNPSPGPAVLPEQLAGRRP